RTVLICPTRLPVEQVKAPCAILRRHGTAVVRTPGLPCAEPGWYAPRVGDDTCRGLALGVVGATSKGGRHDVDQARFRRNQDGRGGQVVQRRTDLVTVASRGRQ